MKESTWTLPFLLKGGGVVYLRESEPEARRRLRLRTLIDTDTVQLSAEAEQSIIDGESGPYWMSFDRFVEACSNARLDAEDESFGNCDPATVVITAACWAAVRLHLWQAVKYGAYETECAAISPVGPTDLKVVGMRVVVLGYVGRAP